MPVTGSTDSRFQNQPFGALTPSSTEGTTETSKYSALREKIDAQIAAEMAKLGGGLGATEPVKSSTPSEPAKPVIAEQYTDKSNGELTDVAEAPVQVLSKDQQETAAKSGLFTASKNAIAVSTSGGDQTQALLADGVIKDNGIDLAQAKAKHEALSKKTENNLSSTGIDAILANQSATPVQLSGANTEACKNFGLDTREGFLTGGKRGTILTEKGEAQLKELQAKGIVGKDGALVAKDKLSTEQQQYLNGQKADNNHRDALGTVADGKADISVKTGTAADGKDTYAAAKTDDDGNILGTDASKATTQRAHTDAAAAKKQLQLGGLSDEVAAKATTVRPDGSVLVDLSKLSKEERAQLKGNISYSGAGALSLKGEGGDNVNVALEGSAQRLNLYGEGSFGVSTQNKALQVKAEQDAHISGVKGDKLEQLVVKGGNLDTDLKDTTHLQALKIDGTNLQKGLAVNSDQNVAVNVLDSKVAEGQATSIKSEKDVEFKSANMTGGANVDIAAQNVAATIADKSDVGKINIAAQEKAELKGYTGSKAKDVAVKAQDLVLTAGNIQVSGTTDLSGVTNTKAYVGKGAKLGALALNEKASSQNTEFVGETDKVATDLKTATQGKSTIKKVGDGKTADSPTQRDVLKQYYGFTEQGIRNNEEHISEGHSDSNKAGFGQLPGAPEKSWFQQFMERQQSVSTTAMMFSGMANSWKYRNTNQQSYAQLGLY